MSDDDIDSLVSQLKSITNCLYGMGADADSVYDRLDRLARLGKLGAAVEDKARACLSEGDLGKHDLARFGCAVLLDINPRRSELRRLDHCIKQIDERPSREDQP